MASEANDNDGVVEAGVMSEDEEDHVGCNGEGCPNKCASGVDGGLQAALMVVTSKKHSEAAVE